jgi:hypothetical protein
MGYTTLRFPFVKYKDKIGTFFDLISGDGTLSNGIFDIYPDGSFIFTGQGSSTDSDDTWELKFTLIDSAGGGGEIRPSDGSDPHYEFNMPDSNTTYDFNLQSSPTTPGKLPFSTGMYNWAVAVDISFGC